MLVKRKIFAERLKNIVTATNIRQTVIAQTLGMTSAALSQFLHGTALPKPGQLNQILSLLAVEEHTSLELCALLIQARDESTARGVPLAVQENDEKDTADSGGDRLSADEHNADDVYKNIQDKTIRHKRAAVRPISVAEPVLKGVPIINLFDLDDYDSEMSLIDFAGLHLQNTLIKDYGAIGTPVIVKCTGSQLGMRYLGPLQIVVADDVPTGISQICLCKFSDGTYLLLPSNEKSKTYGLDFVSEEKIPSECDLQWALAVIELTVVPLALDVLYGNGAEK